MSGVRQGIGENAGQFALLVIVNAFVGAMVGLERSVLPILGEREFGLASSAAILSFLLTFGPVKAAANLVAGRLADREGRKRMLVAGWLFALPVPFLLMYARDWSWVVAANLFLGLNQGLCWSMAVIMKIDIAGPARRGLASGLNEFSGYLAVGVAAWASAEIAAAYGLRTAPFALGIAFAGAGLALSAFAVRETKQFAEHEEGRASAPGFLSVVFPMSWRDRRFFACHQAGLVNNLNDAAAWALFPLYFSSLGYSIGAVGAFAGLYPAVWGTAQLVTGPLSDRIGRRGLITGGMLVQGAGILVIAGSTAAGPISAGLVLLGLGTAMVYPTLLASVSDLSDASWRATALGVYRFWRDSGYAAGALLAGVGADLVGAGEAIAATGALTLASGLVHHRASA